MSTGTSFFEELMRRNVVRVGVVYLIVAWLLAQVADLLLENFNAPDWVIQAILVVLIIGFPLALVFAWAFEMTPEGLKKEKDVDRTQSITRKTGRKLDFLIIGVLAASLGYFIWESRFSSGAEPGSGPVSPEMGSDPISMEIGSDPISVGKSVAVLPFVNMSSDPEQEYFSDGISEEILNSLAKVRDLKVAGRTSSFAFKGENQDLRKIGETLGVDHILEGSVRKSGTKVRITAQLIQVEDGFHLWSESYDRELTDVFEIQDEIARAILEQLKAHLLDGGTVSVGAVASDRTNSEAYDLYLLARQRIYERKPLSIESAAELLDRAIALDPGYAPAYAQRAIAVLLLTDRNYGRTPFDQALPQAKLYVDKALEIDPQQAEAWAALGLYHNQRPGGQADAIEALEMALDINPNLIDASNWLNIAYNASGRQADAIRVLEDMIERDPLYPPAIGNSMNAFIGRAMFDKAEAVLDRARPYLPGDPIIQRGEALVNLSRGEYAKSLPLAESALAAQPENAVYRDLLGELLLAMQEDERAAELAPPYGQVLALARLGRTEEARIIADKGLGQGDIPNWIFFMNLAGHPEAVIELLDERFPELAAFADTYPAEGLFGYWTMIDVAYAMRAVGREEAFAEALTRARQVYEYQLSLGADNRYFWANAAALHNLAGDPDQALEFIERAIERGFVASWRIVDEWPHLKSLEGDPRFEAAQQRMREKVNAERAALGLQPVNA